MMLLMYKNNNLIITFITAHVVLTSAIKLNQVFLLTSRCQLPTSLSHISFLLTSSSPSLRAESWRGLSSQSVHHLVNDFYIKHSALLVCYMTVHSLRCLNTLWLPALFSPFLEKQQRHKLKRLKQGGRASITGIQRHTVRHVKHGKTKIQHMGQ